MSAIAEVKEKAILFKAEMVRAILSGQKTQTRRLVNPQPFGDDKPWLISEHSTFKPEHHGKWVWQTETGEFFGFGPYRVGQVLWVRETWQYVDFAGQDNGYVYRATDPDWQDMEHWTWRPSLFMPRAACRIRLRVESVGVERLQDISIDDARAEGVPETWGDGGNSLFPLDKSHEYDNRTSVENYAKLWQSINGPGSFEANPFVWKISFSLLTPTKP